MEINIQRINELARKAKAEGLTPAEKEAAAEAAERIYCSRENEPPYPARQY